LAFLDLREHLVKRRGLLRGSCARTLARVRSNKRLGGLLVRNRAEDIAGLGHAGQAEDLDRAGRFGAADRLAFVVGHRAHSSVRDAGDDEVAALERSGLHEDGRDRSALRIEVCFDDAPNGGPVGGCTPWSAATTRMAASVSCAPRARIAVKASGPGVSRNVTLRSLYSI